MGYCDLSHLLVLKCLVTLLVMLCYYVPLCASDQYRDSVLALDYERIKQLRNQQADKDQRALLASIYLQKAKANQDEAHIGWGYLLMYHSYKRTAKAELYTDSCITLAERIANPELLAEAYINKGYIYHRRGDLIQSLDYFELAKSIARDYQLDDLLVYAKFCRAWLYVLSDLDHLAIPIFEETLAYFEANQLKEIYPRRYCQILESLGASYSFVGEVDKARATLQKGIIESKRIYPLLTGRFEFILCDLEVILKNGETVLPTLIRLKQSWPDTSSLYYLDISKCLSEALLQSGAIEQALIELNYLEQKCLHMSAIDQIHYLQDLYGCFSEHYVEQKSFELASIYLQKKSSLDSLAGYVESEVIHEMEFRERLEKLVRPSNKSWLLYVAAAGVPIVLLISFRLWKQHQTKQEADKKADQSQAASVDQEILTGILERLTAFEASDLFLHKQYDRSSLAAQLQTNTTYLSLTLKAYRGLNFTTYMKKLRVERIAQILREEEMYRLMTNEAIAKEFGFSSGRILSKAFKEVLNCSLTQYIKNIS